MCWSPLQLYRSSAAPPAVEHAERADSSPVDRESTARNWRSVVIFAHVMKEFWIIYIYCNFKKYSIFESNKRPLFKKEALVEKRQQHFGNHVLGRPFQNSNASNQGRWVFISSYLQTWKTTSSAMIVPTNVSTTALRAIAISSWDFFINTSPTQLLIFS